jgi:hypothetical protein
MIAIGAVILAMILVVVFRSGEEPETEARPPTPTRAVTQPGPGGPAATPPFTTATTPGGFDEGFDTGEETPTPEPSADSKAQTPAEACVSFRWTAGLRAGSEEALPIDVTVSNACSYDVASVNLTFQATGYRGEEIVQTAQGSFAGSLAQGASASFTITLPSTPGGFDRVDLQPAG